MYNVPELCILCKNTNMLYYSAMSGFWQGKNTDFNRLKTQFYTIEKLWEEN